MFYDIMNGLSLLLNNAENILIYYDGLMGRIYILIKELKFKNSRFELELMSAQAVFRERYSHSRLVELE